MTTITIPSLKLLGRLTVLATLISPLANAATYEVRDGELTRDGSRISLFGISWFGAETLDHVPHGLWSRNYKDMIAQMTELGFNAVRLPLCPGTLDNAAPTSINDWLNPDLQGLGGLEILDAIVAELDRSKIYILLDHHRPDCQSISELWYTATYSEQQWIDDLVFLAERYQDIEHFIGIDLKNEPHGAATWGVGDPATDWNLAAERAAAAVLAANPDILVFVEGVGDNPVCSSDTNHWWGGNLEPERCAPLDIAASKLVFSPHVYGPDVFAQPYFDDPMFPANMPPIWDQHFGFLADQGRALAPGELGGKYGHGGEPSDVDWQNALIDYFIDKRICNTFYWSWNPNSGDTGGILQDDWTSIWQDKYENLYRLKRACAAETPPACDDGLDNDDDGLIDLADPGCTGPTDPSEKDAPTPFYACSDGRDNDGDGLVDLDDPGCVGPGDDDEQDPPAPAAVDVEILTRDDWGSGYCADGLVTNANAASIEWRATIDIGGAIRDFWNGEYTLTNEGVQVKGAPWNAVLAPGAATSFGFCAERDQPPAACADGADNDGDGLIDLDDPGCAGVNDDDERNPAPIPPQCADGKDNDGDGLTDLLDPGCDDDLDDDEYNAPGTGLLHVELITQSDWGSGYCADVIIRNDSSEASDWTVQLAIEGHIRNAWNAIAQQTGSQLTLEGVGWNNTVPAGGSVQSVGFCAGR